MTMSRKAKDYRNKVLREKYANDPDFRKKEIARVERYWERKAAEAEALEKDQGQSHDDQTEREEMIES